MTPEASMSELVVIACCVKGKLIMRQLLPQEGQINMTDGPCNSLRPLRLEIAGIYNISHSEEVGSDVLFEICKGHQFLQPRNTSTS